MKYLKEKKEFEEIKGKPTKTKVVYIALVKSGSGKRIGFLCDYCGKEKIIGESRFGRSVEHFCSRKCFLEAKKSSSPDLTIIYSSGKVVRWLTRFLLLFKSVSELRKIKGYLQHEKEKN